MLDNAFKIGRRGSTPRREVIGGITTFVTMAYIINSNGLTAGLVLAALCLTYFLFGLPH